MARINLSLCPAAGVLLVLIAFFAFAVLFSGKPDHLASDALSNVALRTADLEPAGHPQLISIEPLPETDGEMCQWSPASAGENLAAILAEQQSSQPSGGNSSGPAFGKEIERAPVRVIRDTYPTYSAIAVDTKSNEVYLEDENLFGYRVFNRTDNTPASVAFTEPKRMVGGIHTKLEFNCGLYVDPKTGDVYSVNNDTVDSMVVFPRDARGDVAPMRDLHIPHGSYGIAVDEGAEELFLTVEHINSVVVYRKTAKGEDKPIRTLGGDHTGLADPHGIAVDTKNNWIFVTNHGNAKDSKPPRTGRFEPPSITVYPLKASGDTAPLRTIAGPRTTFNWPAHVYADPEHGEIFVANDVGDSILVFRETDQGDAAPIRTIHGPKAGLKNPTGLFVDSKNDELWVSNMGNHSARVFARSANGDVAPLRIIRSAPAGKLALAIGNPGGAAYDDKRGEILVPN